MLKITKLPNGGELYEYDIGSKYWYLNGARHREDGPAIDNFDGTKEWWINDEQISCITQEEFERFMKLKAFW
jgi:hypothetical protein